MSLTRNSFLSVLLLVFVGVSLYILIRSFLVFRNRSRARSEALSLIVIGLGLVAALAVVRWSDLLAVLRLNVEDVDGTMGVFLAVASLVVGAAVGDYVFGRLIPQVAAWLASRRAGPTAGSAGWALPLLVTGAGAAAVLFALVSVNAIDPRVQGQVRATGTGVEVRAEYPLMDDPRDLVFVDARSGYISSGTTIDRFTLPEDPDGALELRTVTSSDEVTNPRGLAFMSGFLFVAEQGERDPDAPGGLYSDAGSVLRFRVDDDGGLSERTVVVDGVPIGGDLHGINGIADGPDEKLYLAVGGDLSLVDVDVPNIEWLGTILRFGPGGEDLEIYARGFRNVYDLEFDEAGLLWGVDNDGPTFRGYRGEEIIQIKEDHHYGYPDDGTFGPYEVRTDPPVWSISGLEMEGSAGIELSENLGLEPGLLIGARVLSLVRFDRDESGVFASGQSDQQAVRVLFERQGYFTIVEAGPDGLLYVGVNGLSLESNLYVLEVTEG